MTRVLGVAGLLATLVACLEPFGVDRHDLEGDRIAMMAVTPAQARVGTTIEGRVALIVDDRPYADAPVELSWHWLADRETDTVMALDPGDPADATGHAPSLVVPAFPSPRLALVARFPSGTVERGFIDLPIGAERPPPVVTGLEFAPDEPIAVGDHRRITATVDPEEPVPMVRWMTVGGRGTFREETRVATRWDAAAIVYDEGEIESEEPIAPGVVTFVALAVDPRGGNGLRVEERWVGPEPTGLFTGEGRWIGTDVVLDAPGTWHGVLEADDDAPTGLRLTGLTQGPVPGVDPWGTGVLPCAAPTSGPFEPTWLFEARCLRGDVVGATVAVDP